jgi:hypothetical protein
MAKLAVINRGEKRRKIVEKYAKKRAELVADHRPTKAARSMNALRRA